VEAVAATAAVAAAADAVVVVVVAEVEQALGVGIVWLGLLYPREEEGGGGGVGGGGWGGGGGGGGGGRGEGGGGKRVLSSKGEMQKKLKRELRKQKDGVREREGRGWDGTEMERGGEKSKKLRIQARIFKIGEGWWYVQKVDIQTVRQM
jgi:hypothetical protein